MKFEFYQNTPKLFLILILSLLPLCPFYASAENLNTKPTSILIDPGHGGRETGAKSITGLKEKDFNLYMAFALKNRLEKNFRVELTRNSDYFTDNDSRVNKANTENYQVVISIHAGSLFTQTISNNVFIGYFDSTVEKDEAPEIFLTQNRHINQSNILAKSLSKALKSRYKTIVAGAPFINLGYINRPAVLIEVGNLNSPPDSVNMKNPEYIESTAEMIALGIKNYIRKQSDITSD
ncbi:MAG: N-acetylmuramoyl-L-alanine amidase family protein [Thermodesulfobacteriota bacterium]